jgi:hypothetical protein
VLTKFQQIWKCYNYIDCSNKVNLTNTAAMIIGSVIGTIISWWIQIDNRKLQINKIKLQNIERLEIKQERILEIVHEFEESHDEMLKTFLH